MSGLRRVPAEQNKLVLARLHLCRESPCSAPEAAGSTWPCTCVLIVVARHYEPFRVALACAASSVLWKATVKINQRSKGVVLVYACVTPREASHAISPAAGYLWSSACGRSEAPV